MLKNTNNYFGDSDNHRPVDHVSFCLLAMRLRKKYGQFHLVVNEFLNKHWDWHACYLALLLRYRYFYPLTKPTKHSSPYIYWPIINKDQATLLQEQMFESN